MTAKRIQTIIFRFRVYWLAEFQEAKEAKKDANCIDVKLQTTYLSSPLTPATHSTTPDSATTHTPPRHCATTPVPCPHTSSHTPHIPAPHTAPPNMYTPLLVSPHRSPLPAWKQLLLVFLPSLLAFVLLDGIWIGLVASDFYMTRCGLFQLLCSTQHDTACTSCTCASSW